MEIAPAIAAVALAESVPPARAMRIPILLGCYQSDFLAVMVLGLVQIQSPYPWVHWKLSQLAFQKS
ncbi:hypothetical protein KGQ27_03980 [Patescibacteria group bacterium]|nr:hypothetical protein [Patescibacteria group bacterium]MDE2011277.1 hypothetical protein [Patescibacteria group bacterium]